MSEPPPGPPVIRELDFSEFHPLDHTPATRYCRSLPGGTRKHLEYLWDFKWRPELHRTFMCPLGGHHFTDHWRGTGETWRACSFCAKPEPRS